MSIMSCSPHPIMILLNQMNSITCEATVGNGAGWRDALPHLTFHQDLFCNSYKYDKKKTSSGGVISNILQEL